MIAWQFSRTESLRRSVPILINRSIATVLQTEHKKPKNKTWAGDRSRIIPIANRPAKDLPHWRGEKGPVQWRWIARIVRLRLEGGEDPSFAEFIKRIRAGDEQAAMDLVVRYEPAIRRAVRVRLRDQRLRRLVESVDICQSVFASFFVRTSLGQYDLESPDQADQTAGDHCPEQGRRAGQPGACCASRPETQLHGDDSRRPPSARRQSQPATRGPRARARSAKTYDGRRAAASRSTRAGTGVGRDRQGIWRPSRCPEGPVRQGRDANYQRAWSGRRVR